MKKKRGPCNVSRDQHPKRAAVRKFYVSHPYAYASNGSRYVLALNEVQKI